MHNIEKARSYALTALFFVFLVIILDFPVVGSSSASNLEPVFQKGMSYRPAPYTNYNYSSPESDESLQRMAKDNVKWIAITTWWFQGNLTSTEIYPHSDFTPTNDSLKHVIQEAHSLGMNVMLKPMVDTEDARYEPRWMIKGTAGWFASYSIFITRQARLAQEDGVELLSVGCEFKTTEANSSEWRQIISAVRSQYDGPLTYAATSDSYKYIAWWDALDYVGIDSYFDLTSRTDPTLEELKNAWNTTANDIQTWYDSNVNRPIIFTEIGYRSGNGNNMQPWNWTAPLELDLQEQFDCYLAALQTLWWRPWFYGLYWWIWESNPNAGGVNDTDFTPQNKPVEYLVRSWYSSEPDPTISNLKGTIKQYQNQNKSLNGTINSQNQTITDLLAQNQTLGQNLTEVQNNYSELLNKYNANTYLLYILVGTTIFLAITAAIFFRRSHVRRR